MICDLVRTVAGLSEKGGWSMNWGKLGLIVLVSCVKLIGSVKTHTVHQFSVEGVVESIIHMITRLVVLDPFSNDSHQECTGFRTEVSSRLGNNFPRLILGFLERFDLLVIEFVGREAPSQVE